ncbi:MAG: hypothetical protein V8S96_02515 [Lachnospiraceae bacterium]
MAQNEKYGVMTDVSNPDSVIEGLDSMMERYGIKGVVLHTKDYSMYYGEELKNTDIEKGLTMEI